jgi:hypothetical protein
MVGYKQKMKKKRKNIKIKNKKSAVNQLIWKKGIIISAA